MSGHTGAFPHRERNEPDREAAQDPGWQRQGPPGPPGGCRLGLPELRRVRAASEVASGRQERAGRPVGKGQQATACGPETVSLSSRTPLDALTETQLSSRSYRTAAD